MARLASASARSLVLATSVALLAPACDFGRDDPDAGRLTSIDAATTLPDSDLDAPGLDAFVVATDDTGSASTDDTGSASTDDTGAAAEDDAAAMGATDTGPDAPRVSMPCTAAGACDPFVADSCGAGMACRGGAMGAPAACASTAAMVRGIGEACTVGNQCIGGSACLDFGDGLRCQQLCPMGSIGSCGSGFACNGTITGGDACIQVCRPLPEVCDIYTQDCVDPTEACTFATNPETGERYTGCRTAGTRTDGQPCGGGMGSCARGLVCITEMGVASCHFACDPDTTPTTCPAMQACTGTARSWGVGYCQSSM